MIHAAVAITPFHRSPLRKTLRDYIRPGRPWERAIAKRFYREVYAKWCAIAGVEPDEWDRQDYTPLGETETVRESIADAIAEISGEKPEEEPWETKTLNQLEALKSFGDRAKLLALCDEAIEGATEHDAAIFRKRYHALVDMVCA
jgi:hypothetical protein